MNKKLFGLLLGCLFAVYAGAQGIVYDRTASNGLRTVVCSGTNTGVAGQMDVYVALAGFQATNGNILYSLAVTIGSGHEIQIPQGGKLVLTLANGKTVTLTTVQGGAARLDAVDVELDAAYTSYSRFTYYNIKKKELKKLSQGVASIEIQLLPQSYSMTFSQDKLGTLLSSSMTIVNQAFGKKK